MKRSAVFFALLLAAGLAHAEDGLSLGIGVDYSSGDYGSDTTTKILSVPVSAKYATGDWTFKASLPWVRVEGDANVVPGLGSLLNLNPKGRGRGNGGGGTTAATTGTTSGIGDLRLAATYAIPLQGRWGVDVTGNVKVATADEDKGLGTGANDYGAAVDVYRSVGDATTLFGGVGYTVLGDSDFIEVDSVWNSNVGLSHKIGNSSLGLMYDYRQPTSEAADDRSEVTGFYSFPTSDASKMQVYATSGLSDGSPDWGAGINFTAGF
ncbi:transporter [Lysobacter terrae]